MAVGTVQDYISTHQLSAYSVRDGPMKPHSMPLWLSLAPVCAGQLCRTEEYGRFYGTVYIFAAFGVLLTVPIGGELIQSTRPQALIGFYAAVLLTGLASVVLSRWALLDWNWRWKVKI
ncbi:hypothetical protein MAP00_007161 [Monascus purpureus]|nr:hypothetical protein MAP00_007161 [Monascus purpureus]